ncbi:uncharacterized protein L201_001586 [Kwoniella dendrophila CBS 6074]|uniref:FYVE-type domain-containing protein n=1 Tax=Kwoniella dendrophila CBS 6074 TaxID=1295534 RepID=A0AAX4JPN7_9TREE
MSVTPALPSLTTTPPPFDPPRRRFGSFNNNNSNSGRPNLPSKNNRPTSSSSTTSLPSITNSPALIPPPSIGLGVQRTRSSSSASVTSSTTNSNNNNNNHYHQQNNNNSSQNVTPIGSSSQVIGPGGPVTFDIGLAADKAQQWLSTWAPKGEGRSREFFTNTLNGVANVASQVSSNITNIPNSRSNSFVSNNIQSGNQSIIPPTPPTYTYSNSNETGSAASQSQSNSPEERFGLSISPSPNPPSLNHSTSTPLLSNGQQPPTGRRIPQPANLARLGHSTSSTSSVPTTSALTAGINKNGSTTSLPSTSSSNTNSTMPARTISSNLGSASTSTTNLHGPSHLNPNLSPNGPNGSGHRRNSSNASITGINGPQHRRTSSFGLVNSLSKSPSISRSSSLTKQHNSMKSAGMPYKIGFQPQGVRNDRTEEFLKLRKLKGQDREREEGRLGRRWAKLVDLHFNPTAPPPTPPAPTLTRSSSSTFSISSLTSGGGDRRRSLLSIDAALDALKPKEVWKGFKNGPGPGGEEGKKRAAEQAIVKWEDDNEVKKCRICESTFSLSNRKHHCRLCGKIICSLQPTPKALLAVQIQLFKSDDNVNHGLPPGTRKEKCSLLLVADYKTGRGEEVEEGFIGWMKMEDSGSNNNNDNNNQDQSDQQSASPINKNRMKRSRVSTNSITSTINENPENKIEKREIPLPQQPKEVQVKGCRVCRDCWNVVSRKQKMQDRQRVTGFAKLYSALRSLQGEIEELMPEFEDQLAELTQSDNPLEPTSETLITHKQLLTLLTQYEHLSKRIGSLNCEEGSSQAIVQSAVARTSASFLAKEMVKLQTLQKLQKKAANAKRKSMRIHELSLSDSLSLNGESGNTTPTSELEKGVEDIAVILQPLLEQEAQLETYISDANSQRKYEDSKALNEALKEIKSEIERITQRVSTTSIR